MAGRRQTSGSAQVGTKPISYKVSARCARKAAPELLRPYRALQINIIVPASDQNSGPARVQIFSRQSAVRYAFGISQAMTVNPLSAAMVSAMRTE